MVSAGVPQPASMPSPTDTNAMPSAWRSSSGDIRCLRETPERDDVVDFRCEGDAVGSLTMPAQDIVGLSQEPGPEVKPGLVISALLPGTLVLVPAPGGARDTARSQGSQVPSMCVQT